MSPTRPLTADERQASEAAFLGAPFNPRWSHAARQVYDGLRAALANMGVEATRSTPGRSPLRRAPRA